MPSLDLRYYACNHIWQPYEYSYEQFDPTYQGYGQCLRLKSFICPNCFSTKYIDQTQDYGEYAKQLEGR